VDREAAREAGATPHLQHWEHTSSSACAGIASCRARSGASHVGDARQPEVSGCEECMTAGSVYLQQGLQDTQRSCWKEVAGAKDAGAFQWSLPVFLTAPRYHESHCISFRYKRRRPLTRAGKPWQDLHRSYMPRVQRGAPSAPASPPGSTRQRRRALAKQGLGHQGKPP